MQKLGIIITLALFVACHALLPVDKNDQWRKNNHMLKNFDDFYLMTPVTTSDAMIKSKRFIAVLSSALIHYSASNAVERFDRVKEAVNQTKAVLEQSADALAGPMRSYLSLLKDVFGKPSEDVKASCSPNTTQSDCDKALSMYRRKNKEKCIEYEKNIDLYEKSRHFFAGSEFDRFMKTVPEVAENGDEMALAFFVDMVLVEFIDLVKEGRSLYRLRAHNHYPCNLINLALF